MFNHKFSSVLKHPGYNFGGSPPPAAPTSTTVNQTNIPDYAQPYVMNMLNAAQAQIYNPSGTGFNPYIPYSNNPANYVAGPSPMQQQAYTNVANMQVPGQYGMATGQTLGASRQLGGLGQQMGMAGMNYANQATNPASVNAYMNPYIQASLAPQLALANQQYGIAGQQEQSGATQAGAFGGSREALMNSLNQQNQMLAQNQLISQGYNNAFNQAQQAQQFGANLGLQGQQGQMAALQGQLGAANQLGSLGGAQLAAQQGISNQLNTLGQQQQQNQQQIINQAVQNYATAQQYPYMQLGTLNAMLRGLPMNQVSTATYMAPPSGFSQIAGLGAAAAGAALKSKKGGVIKAAGGIPLNMMNEQEMKSPFLDPAEKVQAPFVAQNQNYIRNNPQALPVLSQNLSLSPEAIRNAQEQRVGLNTITTPPDMTRMAGGGIIAFAEGTDDKGVPPPDDTPITNAGYEKTSLADAGGPGIKLGDTSAVGLPDLPVVESPKEHAKAAPKTLDWTDVVDNNGDVNLGKLFQMQAQHKTKTNLEVAEPILAEQRAALEERKKNALADALIAGGLKTAAGKSQYGLTNIAEGAGYGFDTYQQGQTQNLADLKNIASETIEANAKDQARQDSLINSALSAYKDQLVVKQRKQWEEQYHNSLLDAKNDANARAAQSVFDVTVDKKKKELSDSNLKSDTNYSPAEIDQIAYESGYNQVHGNTSLAKYLNLTPPAQYAAETRKREVDAYNDRQVQEYNDAMTKYNPSGFHPFTNPPKPPTLKPGGSYGQEIFNPKPAPSAPPAAKPAAPAAAPAAAPVELTPIQAQAKAWADAHPNDPKAIAIYKTLPQGK